MFSKNIKVLSLFLVLAVVMIGALGAVSAADAGDLTGDNVNIVTDNASASVDYTGAGTVHITGDVKTNTTVGTTSSIDNNTPVNDTLGDSALTGEGSNVNVDGTKIYTKADGTGDTISTTLTGTSSNNLTLNENGTFSADYTFSSTALTNGTTYYLQVTIPVNAVASDGTNYADVKTVIVKYVPFTATTATMNLDKNTSTISYGDDWTYSGTLNNPDGTPVVNQAVLLTITGNSLAEKNNVTVYTGANGEFKFNTTFWNAAGNSPLAATTTENYTLAFNSTGATTIGATLNVTNKNGKVNVVLNDTNINFGDVITINATIVDANGKLMNVAGTLTATLINQATGDNVTVTLNPSTDNTVYTGETSNTLPAGVYYITVSGTQTNYDINASDVNLLTVNKVATNIKGNDTIYTTGDALAKTDDTFIKLVSNSTTGVTNIDGSWTAVLYKADGTPIKSVTVTEGTGAALGTATIKASEITALADGSYYVVINFAADNYLPSNTTVNIVVKKLNTITITNEDLTYDFGTTGNDTYLNITSDKVMNTTVEVFLGNKSLGNVDIKDGKASIDFGKLALQSDDYTVTIVYAGDDTYLPFNATTKLTVVGKNIGNLNTNASIINGVTINSVNKTFTLNLTNSTKDLVNYTGKVNYYIGDKLAGTVNMVEGKVIVDAKTLTGLTNGANILTFQIKNNFTSEQVKVTINTVQLPTDIIADNLTTTNNTNIIIKGSVTNATEGLVTVILLDKDNEPLALAFGVLNADGTFNVSFANYANGVYTANIMYNSTTGLSKNNTKNITVTVNGTAPTPTGNITTNLTINSNFTEAYGEGLNLTGKLTDANGNPIVGQHIALNLTNPTTGASKIYWVTTDTNGEYQLQINLFVGSYTASASYGGFTTADNTTTYLPSGPANGTITVTNGTEPVDNRTATVLSFSNFTETYGQALNFTGTLKTTDGTPIIGQKIGMILSNAAGQSKLYWRTTDSAGEVQLPIELFAGDYTFKCYFEGDSTYQPSNNQTGSITVTA
ncbi:beta strand repeat-containing protein [Methanobrevibacter acididurans]|uniref:beta strand repeat-containing protein n=1 Tax=Methanobrevibacter acididurans TaxID=120963 RepID=UPI0038FD2848